MTDINPDTDTDSVSISNFIYNNLVDKRGAARLLELSVNRVHQLVNARVLLPVHKFGGAHVFDVREVWRVKMWRDEGMSWEEIGKRMRGERR